MLAEFSGLGVFHFSKELLQSFGLLLGKEREVCHFTLLTQQAEELVCWSQIAVHIVKIGQHEFSP